MYGTREEVSAVLRDVSVEYGRRLDDTARLQKELDTARQLNEELRKREQGLTDRLREVGKRHVELSDAVMGCVAWSYALAVQMAIKHREAYNAAPRREAADTPWQRMYFELFDAMSRPALTHRGAVEIAAKYCEAYNATYSTPPVEPLPFDFAFCASHYAFWKRDTLAAISRLVERLP